MKKITDLNTSAIGYNFSIASMIEPFDIASFSGKVLRGVKDDKASYIEPLKNIVTTSNTALSDEVIKNLIDAPKYIIGDIQQYTKRKTSLKNFSDDDLEYSNPKTHRKEEIDYYKVESDDNGILESYCKHNTSLYNGGTFFLASTIDNKSHIFSLNIYESAQSGKSVTLCYLPKGKMADACLLQRVCYHGNNSNDHINTDGTIIDKSDLHIHQTSEKYFDYVAGLKNETSKISALNSADASVIIENLPSNEANISVLVDEAKNLMNIRDEVLEFIGSDGSSTLTSLKNNILDCEMN